MSVSPRAVITMAGTVVSVSPRAVIFVAGAVVSVSQSAVVTVDGAINNDMSGNVDNIKPFFLSSKPYK